MKNRVVDVRQFWLGCILLSTAMGGSAVTLGKHSGAGVIGRPLDIRVQALVGPDEDMSALCVTADVFYGDSQVSAGSVRTSVQRTSPDAAPSVRIQSSIAINEPIVTVHVRAGCSTPFTRRYVLLADPVTEPAKATMGGIVPLAVEPSRSATAASPSVASTADRVESRERDGARRREDVVVPARQPAPAQADRRPEPSRVQKQAKPRAASVVRRPVEPVPESTPRLVLDPIDVSLAIERDPVLKLSLSLLSEPSASEETRAAAGLLWKAINASPEERLRDTRKLELLEAESKGLREAEAKDKAAISALSADLERARYLKWMVYLLGALLLLALLAVVLLVRRKKQDKQFEVAKAWWASEEAQNLEKAQAPAGPVREKALDLDLDLNDDSGLADLSPLSSSLDLADSTPSGGVSTRATSSKAGKAEPTQASRAVATEELSDLQQQTDFFISLGEDEQAIQVLKNHINESQTPSALAYLDLFKLFHKLGRQADYEKLRGEFNRVFNAGAPPFEQYSDQSLGLEAYETAFGRIQALWPEPRVLDVIEQSIFREAGDATAEVFDLEAYRELLLLHAVAKEMIHREAVESQSHKDFQNTKVQPLKATGKISAPKKESKSEESQMTIPMEQLPPASLSLGLDIDLDSLSEISAFEASLPEIEHAVEPSAKPAAPPDAAQWTEDEHNMIDFEVLDFVTPDDDASKLSDKS